MESGVTIEEVARRVGLSNPTGDQMMLITEAIDDAEGEVVAFLGRPISARSETVNDLWPAYGYALTDLNAWPDLNRRFDDRIEILSATAAPDGWFTVECKVGLDVAGDPELRRIRTYIRDAAVESLRQNSELGIAQRRVTSVSAEGQSVSYADPPQGAAGSPSTLDSLRRWKKRTIGMRRTAPLPPWPYSSPYRGWAR